MRCPVEEKPLLECLCILQEGDSREAGATGGSPMKTITIRLPDVEAAMLLEVQKKNLRIKDLSVYIFERIRLEYKQLREK